MNDTGFIEGQNVLIEYRSAEGYPSRLAPLASELVTRQVSVIFCDNIAALAAKAATKSIPIVFAGGGDAVQEGLVVSLNRPGGNVTGVNFFTGTKRLDLLRQIVPNATKIGVLVQPNTPQTEAEHKELEAIAQGIGQQLLVLRVSDAQEIKGAISRLVEWGAGALLVGSGPRPCPGVRLENQRFLAWYLRNRTRTMLPVVGSFPPMLSVLHPSTSMAN